MEANRTEGQKELGMLQVFNQNHHFAYVYKKTEKLVTALYMISNFIKDTEPLKWRIREKGLELLSLNITFNTVSLSDRKDLLKKYQAHSVEIVSLASIAHHSGLISEMNFEILRREFMNLVAVIEKDENKKANEETVMLHPNFFDTPVQSKKPEAPTGDVFYKANERQVNSEPVSFPATPRPERTEPKDNNRRATIIKLLSQKGGLSIKDFSNTIKGCSEKTIQRELLALVAAGTLKKEGERRWSTYSLA